jgi:hypothetical protein
MRQITQRDTDSDVSRAWLTLPSDMWRGNQIWPQVWRIRHKFRPRLGTITGDDEAPPPTIPPRPGCGPEIGKKIKDFR